MEVYDVGWFGLTRKNYRKVDPQKVRPAHDHNSCSALVGFPVIVDGESKISYVDVESPDLVKVTSVRYWE